MKSCWKSECKDAQKEEKALIQYFKRDSVHAGCCSVSNVFLVIKSEPEQNATSLMNGLLTEIE